MVMGSCKSYVYIACELLITSVKDNKYEILKGNELELLYGQVGQVYGPAGSQTKVARSGREVKPAVCPWSSSR